MSNSTRMPEQERVFAGIRATGRQHIGNYLGAIKNFVALQDRYECIYSIVDLHSLTTLTETEQLSQNVLETALDLMAAGLDPSRCILYVQSHVPEVSELHLLLSMVVPNGWLLRVPTFKEKARAQPDNVNYGLVGYPVLQTADIVMYKASRVPVGKDQLPHLELAREIVRRFNHHFGEMFPEPEPALTEVPLLLGADRRKMSKSYDNQIELAASEEETLERVRQFITDPQRQRKTDPGRPEVCNVYDLHEFFDPEERPAIYRKCTQAEWAAWTASCSWAARSMSRCGRCARGARSWRRGLMRSGRCSPTARSGHGRSRAPCWPRRKSGWACRPPEAGRRRTRRRCPDARSSRQRLLAGRELALPQGRSGRGALEVARRCSAVAGEMLREILRRGQRQWSGRASATRSRRRIPRPSRRW